MRTKGLLSKNEFTLSCIRNELGRTLSHITTKKTVLYIQMYSVYELNLSEQAMNIVP